METDAPILITGASGMVGSAVTRLLRKSGYQRLLTPTHAELELLDEASVHRFFEKHRPRYVWMIAAKVGGIAANIANPVSFLSDNVKMETILFEACHRFQVHKSLFLGSSCIYPRLCPQPMKEEYLLTGPLEPTNEGYALAKIVGIKLAEAYSKQHGMNVICPMPSNVYGTGDTFELDRAHVLSSLVRRFVDAKRNNAPRLALWGTGTPRREFIHVEDLANALLFLMKHHNSPEPINVGVGTDVSIRELAEMISRKVGYTGEIVWDPSKPDGMPRKCMDVSRLTALGFTARIGLDEGIAQTIAEYQRDVLT